MIGELAGLSVALIWAVTSLMLKPLSARFNPVFMNCVRSAAAALVILPFLLTTGGFNTVTSIHPITIIIIIAGTIANIGIAESLFILSLRYISLSQVYPISLCGWPLLTLIIATTFLGESLTIAALVGILLILIGIYFAAFPAGGWLPKLSMVSRNERIGLLITLASIIVYAIGTILTTRGIQGVDLILANFIRFSATATILVPFTIRHWVKALARDHDLKGLGLTALNGALALGLAGLIFLFALNRSGAAITSVLTSTSTLFLLPMTVFFLKEKITRKLVVGVIISLIGITLVFIPAS